MGSISNACTSPIIKNYPQNPNQQDNLKTIKEIKYIRYRLNVNEYFVMKWTNINIVVE